MNSRQSALVSNRGTPLGNSRVASNQLTESPSGPNKPRISDTRPCGAMVIRRECLSSPHHPTGRNATGRVRGRRANNSEVHLDKRSFTHKSIHGRVAGMRPRSFDDFFSSYFYITMSTTIDLPSDDKKYTQSRVWGGACTYENGATNVCVVDKSLCDPGSFISAHFLRANTGHEARGCTGGSAVRSAVLGRCGAMHRRTLTFIPHDPSFRRTRFEHAKYGSCGTRCSWSSEDCLENEAWIATNPACDCEVVRVGACGSGHPFWVAVMDPVPPRQTIVTTRH